MNLDYSFHDLTTSPCLTPRFVVASTSIVL